MLFHLCASCLSFLLDAKERMGIIASFPSARSDASKAKSKAETLWFHLFHVLRGGILFIFIVLSLNVFFFLGPLDQRDQTERCLNEWEYGFPHGVFESVFLF